MKHIASWKIGLILLICLGLSLSCGGKVTTRTEEPKYQFTINGVLVKDMNSGKDISYFSILRNSKPFSSALVAVGTDTLTNQGDGTYYKEASELFDFEEEVTVTVSSSSDTFSLSKTAVIPGLFQITSFNPPVLTSSNYHLLKVYGSASAGADGYLIDFIKPNGSNGYAGLVSLIEMVQGIEDIPRETFEESGTYRTGTYTVYVAAYQGGFPSFPGMPFYLPGDLPTGNVPGANGTIGAGVIAPSKSLSAE
jgi:hypothetical protein